MSEEIKKIKEELEEVEEKSWVMTSLGELKKNNQRMFMIILVLIGVLVASNFYWLWTFTQYDFVTYEQSTEGGGNANFIGNDGDIINGEAKSTDSN